MLIFQSAHPGLCELGKSDAVVIELLRALGWTTELEAILSELPLATQDMLAEAAP